ncbi:hypothetical protein Ciccas_011925 [Cichlidogyrus casuarinus]|uniref:Uncharacterized protein n=1 Tax=Cichlidogyrus casuarinus TaxID=1844966 RepID=A0ABD2PR80_9PLAT
MLQCRRWFTIDYYSFFLQGIARKKPLFVALNGGLEHWPLELAINADIRIASADLRLEGKGRFSRDELSDSVQRRLSRRVETVDFDTLKKECLHRIIKGGTVLGITMETAATMIRHPEFQQTLNEHREQLYKLMAHRTGV